MMREARPAPGSSLPRRYPALVRMGGTRATLTRDLVRLAVAVTSDETRVRHPTGRALFDHLACLEAGRRAFPELDDAAAACALDRDDLHWPSVTHPGAIVWPVVRHCGGDPRAAAAGYEVTVRLGLALGPEHRRYWHTSATAGTVGAAVAAALALGLDEERVADAAGHAASVVGGSILAILERSGTRVFHRSHAAATGMAAARAAAAGLDATREGLESERGLFAAMSGDAGALLAEREQLAIEETTFRIYAASGFIHAAIEAARELAPIETAERVEVQVPPATAALAALADPQTDEEAWWSTQYAVAVTLLGLDLEDRSLLADARVRGLLRMVEVRTGEPSIVTVNGRAASCAEARVPTDDELSAKWRTLNPDLAPPLELLE
jgi:2-methylcitrate dehydratase PrpD